MRINKPSVKFEVQSLDYSVKSLLLFDGEELYNYSYKNFGISPSALIKLNNNEKFKYLKKALKKAFNDKIFKLQEVQKALTTRWNQIKSIVFDEFEKIFGFKFSSDFDVYTANLTLNHICPRFLDKKTFDLSYVEDIDFLIEIVIHELTHFVWFEKWKHIFPDYDVSQFEYPHKVWIFSELAIDPIFKNTKLKQFSRPNPAYSYFYGTIINNTPIMNYFNQLFKEHNIQNFLKLGIKFIDSHNDDFVI